MSKTAIKEKRTKQAAKTPGTAVVMPKLRSCPFCGGKMEVRVVASLGLFGVECLTCGALAPTQGDFLRAALIANRRQFYGDFDADPLDDPLRPVLDAAYWWMRLNDAQDLCEFRVVHQQHGPGYWADGLEAFRRKIDAIAENGQTGWSLDIRSLDHGERQNITLEESRIILCQNQSPS